MKEKTINIVKTIDSTLNQELSTLANRYSECAITIEQGTKVINAKSIMGVISLGLKSGDKVNILANGKYEDEVIAKITEILN